MRRYLLSAAVLVCLAGAAWPQAANNSNKSDISNAFFTVGGVTLQVSSWWATLGSSSTMAVGTVAGTVATGAIDPIARSALAKANAALPATGGVVAGSLAVSGHNLAAGSTPVLSSCGTSPTISGSDNAGVFTTGTGATGCILTFSAAYGARPYCTVTGESASVTYSLTKTAITVAVGSAVVVDYQCTGQSGG